MDILQTLLTLFAVIAAGGLILFLMLLQVLICLGFIYLALYPFYWLKTHWQPAEKAKRGGLLCGEAPGGAGGTPAMPAHNQQRTI